MNHFTWISVIIGAGLLSGIFAPFPLILVPILIGGLVTYAIATNQIAKRPGFLLGLGSVNLSVFAMFLISMAATGGEGLANFNAGFVIPGNPSDQAVYLLFAFAETIFYLLTLVVSKMMLPGLYDSQKERSISDRQGIRPAWNTDSHSDSII